VLPLLTNHTSTFTNKSTCQRKTKKFSTYPSALLCQPYYCTSEFHVIRSNLFQALYTNAWIQSSVYKRVIKRFSPMFKPRPRFKLSHLQYLFYIHHSLFEQNCVPLVPYTPHNSCPNTFPNLILLNTCLTTVKTFKMVLNLIMLH